MSGEVLRIGPFAGGLNLASDVSSVADEELVECVNFELDIDGSLKSRPPYVKAASNAPVGHKIIGSAVFSGTGYIFSSGTDAGTQSIQRSTDGINWVSLSTGRLADVAVQYRDKVWFPASQTSTASNGMNWDPSSGTSAVAAMPRASHAVVHKERLYVVPGMGATTNSSRLSFSAPADLTDWPAPNTIDVSPGDGETLNAIIVYNDNLLLFKNNSVFVLAYDLDPSDAILREINPVLGVRDGDSLEQFENVVYALHEDIVYEIVNYDFNPINIKVPFVLDTTTPTGQTRLVDSTVSLIGERLVIKYFSKIYVFGLRTRTWGEWSVTIETSSQWHETGKFWRLPGTTNYFSRRAYGDVGAIFKVPDQPTAADLELDGTAGQVITCTAKTKDFDMSDPVHYKRMFWWSADILAGDRILGQAFPVSYSFAPVWSEMTMSWGEVIGTWGQPLSEPFSVSTEIDPDNNFILAKTVKFMKALRFRKIAFSVELDTVGSSSTQVKLFSLTATVLTKQRITQKVS